ncbi:MAG: type III-B CRISPR module-associated protein Cmr5 [Nitrospirota bacterium]|nr:type III-B CRISPR module-associated protein Cmr5 [Nitrospirota bacterium]
MSMTLEQERAKYAFDAIAAFTGDKGKYATHIKKLPAMILNNGLGQALAYLLADDKGEYSAPSWSLYSQLRVWMTRKCICSGNDLMDSLMKGDSTQYMHAQHESLKLLAWMTKFADAYLPKTEGG